MNFHKTQLLFWASFSTVTSSIAEIDSIFNNCTEIKVDYFSKSTDIGYIHMAQMSGFSARKIKL